MSGPVVSVTLLLLLALSLAAAAGQLEAADDAEPELVGSLTREEIEAVLPDWVSAQVEAEIDLEAAATLAGVGAGHTIDVYLGTWCSDSRRELARFWRALDAAGGWVPFHVTYVGIDREKAEPAGAVAGAAVERVPTFVVSHDGRERGRVVETSPGGIEHDLLALLTGEAEGVLTVVEAELDGPGGEAERR